MRLSLLTRIALGVVLPMVVWSSGVLLLFVGLKGHLPSDFVGWLVVLGGLALVITVLQRTARAVNERKMSKDAWMWLALFVGPAALAAVWYVFGSRHHSSF
ncbi:MAG: hypothetical protein WBV82_25680 [Myxococcaceae bacterium]